MILGFDIGNTHIVPIFYNEDGNILATFRIPTHLEFTEDTLFIMLNEFAKSKNLEISNIKNIIVSSVVPNINENFTRLGKKYFEIDPTFVTLDNVENKIKEIKILPNMERGLGADRIVDILAVKKLYPEKELLIIDFGTATTFDMIKDSTYMGGCIIPGIALSINALFSNTAALPKIEFTEPETVLGINTASQINAGIFYGNVGSIKELILQYKKFFPNAYVIATGGQGEKISEYIKQIDEYVPKLGEMGIFEFYRLNFLKENSDGICWKGITVKNEIIIAKNIIAKLLYHEYKVKIYYKKNDDSRKNQDFLVLLHGIYGKSSDMESIAQNFKDNYRIINIQYPTTKETAEEISDLYIEPNIENIKEQIFSENFHKKIGNQYYEIAENSNKINKNFNQNIKINFVAHSMGTGILRYYLKENPLENLGKVVFISPPSHGSHLADVPFVDKLPSMLGKVVPQFSTKKDSFVNQLGEPDYDYMILIGNKTNNPLYSMIIRGKDDGMVPLKTAKMKSDNFKIIENTTHTSILKDKRTMKEISEFFKSSDLNKEKEK